MPRPADLTPADTSSTVAPGLAAALRRQFRDVDEIVVEQSPDAASIAAVRDRAAAARAVVIGTIDGHRQPAQIELVEALAGTGTPVVAVALRGPWDVAAYPPGVTALATYSILPASLEALAAVLAGKAEAPGRLRSRSGSSGDRATNLDEIGRIDMGRRLWPLVCPIAAGSSSGVDYVTDSGGFGPNRPGDRP